MNQEDNKHIRVVAVLGAGIMGAQIAAHLVNAEVPIILFDLPAKAGDKNAQVVKAIENLKKIKPSPLARDKNANLITPANYDEHLHLLKSCDLVIEVIAEKMDWKESLYRKIAPHLGETTILATNTSGLSIQRLSEALPTQQRTRFLGIHFFNPPRYMHLVELIPNSATDKSLLQFVETFMVSTLGKGVIYAKDTPNFIANRVGVFSLLAMMYHAARFNIPFEVVDQLTGSALGRPKSATFRTLDIVGLDTLAHVIHTMQENLPDDPWRDIYHTSEWLQDLIKQGALGQKTGKGIYQKQGQVIHVYDINSKSYRTANQESDKSVIDILKIKNPQEKFTALQQTKHPQAQFLWAYFCDLFHYCAYHLQDIAQNTSDIDFALRWGFAWQQGIFETWQSIGWMTMRAWLQTEIANNKTMAKAQLPSWVNEINAAYHEGIGYSPVYRGYHQAEKLPVYQRQLFPPVVITAPTLIVQTIFETDDVHCWHQSDGIAIMNFKTKMNTITDGVLDGIQKAIDIAEKKYLGLILWQRYGNDFSAGANLVQMLQTINEKGKDATAKIIRNFQKTALRLHYAMIPTIAAMRGRGLGGGCELPLQCHRIVAGLETYIGLVEIGVGLLPAGGGMKEMAKRAAETAQARHFPDLLPLFKQIVMAEVSTSAVDARDKKYMQSGDVVVFNPDEILYVAKQEIRAMVETNFRPPVPTKFAVAGKQGIADLQYQLANYRAGGFITEYDNYLAMQIAKVICGGEIEMGSLVTEQWILDLECETFVELLAQPKSQERIQYILKTGKPLQN